MQNSRQGALAPTSRRARIDLQKDTLATVAQA